MPSGQESRVSRQPLRLLYLGGLLLLGAVLGLGLVADRTAMTRHISEVTDFVRQKYHGSIYAPVQETVQKSHGPPQIPMHSRPGQREAEQTTAASANGKVNMVYFTNWGIYARDYPPQKLPVDQLTHVLYAFADVSPETGHVFLTDKWSDLEKHYDGDSWNDPDANANVYGNIKQLFLLKKRNRSLKVLLSIGGWTYGPHFSPMASDAAKRARFAASAVALMEDIGFDGVDIDWEYPKTSQEAQNFVALLAETRSALDRHAREKGEDPTSYLLTIAAPCGPETYDVLSDYIPTMDYSLSYWNLMAYDFAGSWSETAGHQSNLYSSREFPLSVDAAVRWYKSRGVDPSKIIIGMPLYGRSFLHTAGPGHKYNGQGPGSWEKGTYDYKVLPLPGSDEVFAKDIIASSSYDRKSGHFITYDNPAVADTKSKYIVGEGLAGAMYWDASGDSTDTERSLVHRVAGHFVQSRHGLEPSRNHLNYPKSHYSNLRNGFR